MRPKHGPVYALALILVLAAAQSAVAQKSQTSSSSLPVERWNHRGRARGSMLLFLAGIVVVVIIGMFPQLRPMHEVVNRDGLTDSDQVSMGMAIMIVMMAVAGLTMILFKASPEATLKGTIMRSGLTAIISILGVSWLGSSFFEGNRNYVVGTGLIARAALSNSLCRRNVFTLDPAV